MSEPSVRSVVACILLNALTLYCMFGGFRIRKSAR